MRHALRSAHRAPRASLAARRWCPNCGLLVLLPEEGPPPPRWRRLIDHFRRPDPLAHQRTCPHCAHRWDRRDKTGDAAYDDEATRAMIRLTSKPCPNRRCRTRTSHFHGHGCHQIAPYTDGCPACHQHFCYVCLRKHGRPGGGYERHPRCRHGSSFCNSRDIHANLVLEPYPHDRRCGCQICSHCAYGRPCEQCPGNCVVCTGEVPPGPKQLTPAMLHALRARESSWTSFCRDCRS